jgi:hypothetical protein
VRASAVVQQAIEGDRRRLSFRAVFGDGGEVPVFHEVADSGPLAAPGDPWLPLLVAPAMALHEDLYVDAPVSRALLDAANERIGPVLARLFPEFARVEIHAAEVVDTSEAPPTPGTAAFYSGGLDSAWTFARQRERLTHLVFVHGFDLPPSAERARAEVALRVRRLAEENGLELIEMASSARRHFAHAVQARVDALPRPHVNFATERQLGCLLTSFGQALAGRVGRLIFAASWSTQERNPVPAGSHPWIEPNWSTPALAIELDAWDLDRVGKAAGLARHRPDLLRTVRVCQARPHRVNNCGRCGKCMRLRLELAIAGVRPEDVPFAEPFDHRTMRRSGVATHSALWKRAFEAARENGDPELIRTAEILSGQRLHLRREWARSRGSVRRLARRIARRLA